jgi:hypothetical protein
VDTLPADRLKERSGLWRKVINFVRRSMRVAAGTSLPELLLIGSFILARYLLNADFSYPSEIILPFAIFAVVTAVVFFVFRLILRKNFPAHLAALLVVYLLYDFNGSFEFVRRLLPDNWQAFPVSLVTIFVLLMLGAGFALGVSWLVEHVHFLKKLQLHKVVLFAIAFIFIAEAAGTGWQIIQIQRELNYHYQTPAPKRTGTTTNKPDVYYLVFDRYANDTTLKNNYNYDNSKLLGFLQHQGFSTRSDAYANYPFTMQSISSTLAMNYLPSLEKQFGNDSFQTAFPYRDILSNAPAAQLLKQSGYTYNQVSSWWDFTRIGIRADNNPTQAFDLKLFGHDIYLSDLQRDIVNKSVLSPLLKQGLGFISYEKDTNPRQNFEEQIAELKKLASRPDKSVPQFTFAHFLVPHDPYIFDADGNDPAYNGNRNDAGIDETQKYTNQVAYLNERMENLIGQIRKDSPNAAIIIQSDEGPYPKDFRFTLTPNHYYDPINLALPQMRQKFGVLASYYMPGVDAQTVAQSIPASVDPLRFVLSHYLGYDLPMLPDCQFATGDKYTIYKYKQVTGTLRGGQDPAICKQYE